MLTGPRLSPVQTYACVVLDSIKIRDQAVARDRQLRLAMLTAGLYESPADLFEEFKEVITDDEAEIADDETATKYVFNNAKMQQSQDEVEKQIQEMLAAASHGTASFDEISFGDWM